MGGRGWTRRSGASAVAANTSVASHAEPVAGSVKHNGQHDFDFEFGTWKAHIRRLQHPLTGCKDWVEYDGSSIVRKVWGGRANLGELDVQSRVPHSGSPVGASFCGSRAPEGR
jgi:hypothetical protein